MRGAGGGRPRKPAGTAVNRMPPTRNDIVVSSRARVASVPEPLLPLVGVQLSTWHELWSQPVATLWTVADVQALTRLVVLATSARALMDPRLLSEMRQLEDRFLLNPYARAQQRVVIVDEEPAEGDTPAPSGRRYGHLRAMGSGS